MNHRNKIKMQNATKIKVIREMNGTILSASFFLVITNLYLLTLKKIINEFKCSVATRCFRQNGRKV
jgi:hypothetical protein